MVSRRTQSFGILPARAFFTKLGSFVRARGGRWTDSSYHPLILRGGIFTIAIFCGVIAVGRSSAFVLARRWILAAASAHGTQIDDQSLVLVRAR